MKARQKYALIALGLLAVFAAGLLYSLSQKESQSPAREIAALVNGKPVYSDQIEKELATLPPGQRESTTKDEVLHFLIEKALLLQEAEKEGIKPTQQEIASLYESYPDAEGAMREQNLTRQDFIDRIAEQAAINRLLGQKTGAAQQVIKGEEVQQIYELNFKPRNISFEDAEEAIIQFLIESKPQILREQYIQSLKQSAEIEILA